METETIKFLLDTYRGDENQLIVLTGIMLGLLSGVLVAFYTTPLGKFGKSIVLIAGSIVYITILFYMGHVSNRMGTIREEFSGKTLKDDQVYFLKYIGEIQKLDYHFLHPAIFMTLIMVMIYGFMVYTAVKNRKVKLPPMQK